MGGRYINRDPRAIFIEALRVDTGDWTAVFIATV